jgi:hypothetical protein
MTDALKNYEKAKTALVAEYRRKEKALAEFGKQLEAAGIRLGAPGKRAAQEPQPTVRAKRKLSKAARAAISKAQKARWAKVKAAKQ